MTTERFAGEGGASPRGQLLSDAGQAVHGERDAAYGAPTQNLANTAEMWTAQLRHKLRAGAVVEPHEVAALLISLKLARLVASPGKRDNWLDVAGYAACGWEVAASSLWGG